MPAKYSAEEMARKVNARYRGGEFFMKCPCHIDSQPSLSFRDDQHTGKVILTCHAGCDNNDIIMALAEMGLWDTSQPGRGSAIYYSYNDLNGNELYRVLRYEDKKFPVGRMIDGSFESGLDDVEPVLYRLDELCKASIDEYVFIAEGEKDADTASRIGLIATTNYGGGNPDKWLESYNHRLKGRKIVLLEDNDKMGVRRVTELAKKLSPIAQSVLIITFKEMKKGADLTDWVEEREAEGVGTAEMKKLLMNMIYSDNTSSVLPQFKSKSLAQMRDEMNNNAEVKWLLEKSLPVNEPFGLIGDPGAGKSTIALGLGSRLIAWRVAERIKRGKILYLLLEGNARNIISAAQELQIDPNDVIVLCDDSNSTRLDLADKNVRNGVIEQILAYEKEFGVALVIFDSFSATSSGISINDPKIAVVMQELNSALDRPGIPIAYINHCKKGTKSDEKRAVNISLGSGTFLGQVRTAFLITIDEILPSVRKLCLIKSNRVSAPDAERDYYFFKHANFAQFVSAEEYSKYLPSDDAGVDAAMTMKAKAKRIIMNLFINEGRDMIPSQEIMALAESNSVSSKVMTEALQQMRVEKVKKKDCWFRYWPMRNLFMGTSSNESHELKMIAESQDDSIQVEYAPDAQVMQTSRSYLFVAMFDGIIAEDMAEGFVVIRLRLDQNPYGYCFKLHGEKADNFSKLVNIHKLVANGDIVHVLTETFHVNPSAATIDAPMPCLDAWPRIVE
jgi:5S rRNA maturation endonuclease (ribonuclease M5)